MLYELIAVVRPGSLHEVRDIARNAGIQVLRSGGVVRGYTNWGVFRLPKPTTKHQARYSEGHHFIMRFDSSGPVQTAVRRTLSLDPRMIRFSVVKLGDKLEEFKDVPGEVEWRNDSRNIVDTI
ncbi:ribosomal protein S6 [Aspergillus egyptiacus]|nr:ribosomal protein S6 [Aspergillus egyptiacus]